MEHVTDELDTHRVGELKEAIRPASLRRFADDWEVPDSNAIRAVLKLAKLTGGEAARRVGIHDSRTVRRWTGGETAIPYAAWALLCEIAGLGKIW
ncbi:transcriptional regulator [Burkholderia aenigmatica]|uniref:transcriptional regulator n=1 Tax=Burkholderia aenigmatica TaxID=2015348 RepID=UPI00264B8776|nr:transcriptional regulator [Burkholderia aenigmatica]MDN7880080.1 transcriptional regulator [Burkholderia aenigmatica]